MADNLFFGWEQGFDALVIYKLLTFGDLTLIGHWTDIPGFFHGPHHYYIMALPYALSGGNPLAASFVSVALGSLVPVVIYFLSKSFLGSAKWGLVSAIIVISSFEFISYARWFNHPALALLFLALLFWGLWKYHLTQKGVYFFLSVIFAAFAAQLEMVLPTQLALVFIFYFGSKLIQFPKIKTLFLSFLAFLFVFSPLIIFNFRHNNMLILSLVKYLSGLGDSQVSLIQKFSGYLAELVYVIGENLFPMTRIFPAVVFYLIFLLGLGLFSREKKKRPVFIFVLGWAMMSLGVSFTGINNLQHYFLGTGLAWIILFTFSTYALIKHKITRLLLIPLVLLLLLTRYETVVKIHTNTRFFFATIQDDLNYRDQSNLLRFVHEDAAGERYRLVSFTIPYFMTHAWDYLHQYYYPQDKYENSKITYLIIESQVASFYEDQWIADLGKTELVWEKHFGKIRLQKRI